MTGGGVHPLGGDASGSRSGAGVDLVLRSFEALDQERLEGVRGLGDQEVELLALDGGEVLEDEAGGVLPTRRAADADTNPQVVLGAGRAGDRPEAVVPALSPAALEAHGAERQVELVMHDDEVLDREVV